MRPEELKPNITVTGLIYPEPVQVLVVIPLGTSVKLIGKGLQSQNVYESVQSSSNPSPRPRKPNPLTGTPSDSDLRSRPSG